MEIAERFCKYFTDIGPNLSRSVSSVNPSFRSHLGDNNHSFINLKPTTTSELESICGIFTSRKAPGYDSFPMRVIKYLFHFISAPLADIINLSLLKGIFPDKLKIAKIIPIFEAEDPCFLETTDLFLCCLISPNFFEKVIYSRLAEFGKKNTMYFTAVSLDFGKIIRHRTRKFIW